MSILVKSVEMPKDGCMDCLLHKWTFAGEMCCITDEIVSGNVERGGFPANCPLISVPEHGDLVDKQYAYQNTMTLGERTRKIVLKQIDALPVVIPADKKENT